MESFTTGKSRDEDEDSDEDKKDSRRSSATYASSWTLTESLLEAYSTACLITLSAANAQLEHLRNFAPASEEQRQRIQTISNHFSSAAIELNLLTLSIPSRASTPELPYPLSAPSSVQGSPAISFRKIPSPPVSPPPSPSLAASCDSVTASSTTTMTSSSTSSTMSSSSGGFSFDTWCKLFQQYNSPSQGLSQVNKRKDHKP